VDTSSQKISEFMQLYKPVQHRLSAYCRVVTGSEEKAFDLIQETLAAAFESFDKLRDAGSFQFFLFGIARNCHLKQQRRWKFFGKQSDIKPANIEVTSDSIEMQYDIELIHTSIAKLNAEQREVILLFHIMGFSISDIAQNLTITEAAVKNRLVRGRENLRKLLSDKETRMINSISANNSNTLTK
jgi:RNA polymerase sigma-70 factor (ECF subfamily)